MNWKLFIGEFGREVAQRFSFPAYPDYNPLTRALKEDEHFVDKLKEIPGYSQAAVSRLATAYQMFVYDNQNGIERDGEPKALRRHWYSWFKTQFAQLFADQLGDYTLKDGVKVYDDRKWAGLLSQTYAYFVDTGEITYRDLWVRDSSRMMQEIPFELFYRANIVIAVEKDSLLQDFVRPATALGARVVYSGKGKSSKAAIELMLRKHFNWYSERDRQYTPLYILHITDHDYDGESVIGPTFGKQARRYSDHVYEARVGIKPEHVRELKGEDELSEHWYSIKVVNKGYEAWALDKALYSASCLNCGAQFVSEGYTEDDDESELRRGECPHCGSTRCEIVDDTAHGFEVEALETRNYYALIVDALLQLMDFREIVEKLRDECKAQAWEVADDLVRNEIASRNASYKRLLEEIERLQDVRTNFENRINEELVTLAEPHEEDFRDEDEDPEPEDFREHVRSRSYVWRPFRTADRNASLKKLLLEDYADEIEALCEEEIEF